jgi:predicted site-specific integrase-resolvase
MADIILPIHLGHSAEKGVYQGAEAIAKAVGVSAKTIKRWKKKGAPIYLVGRKYQCRYDKLWDWIASNESILYSKGSRKIKKAKNLSTGLS